MGIAAFQFRLGRVRTPWVAVVVLLLAGFASAQNSQFHFDPNGNLLVQTAALIAPPEILGQPQNRIVTPGEIASFSIVVRDTRELAYQWRFNGTNISGATNDAVFLQNVSTNNEGEYRVVLTNPSGSVTSAPALLMIDSDADGLPDSWELTFFGNLTRTATADFDGDGISNSNEFFDNTNPTNKLSARFRLTVLADGGGVVGLNPNQPSYTNGEIVTLTATALGTNLFYVWTGESRTTNNPLAVTMTTNKTVRAHFHFLPLDIVWTNTAGGDWHSATNWNPNQVPGALDHAIIPITATVTVSSPAECLGFTLGSGSGNPTLTGSGTLTVYESFLWTSGTMSGSGRTILDTNVIGNIPAAVTLATRTFENRGFMLLYDAGALVLIGGAVITNCPGALFHVVNEATTFGGGVGNGRFDNAGTFRKSSGTGTLTVNSGMNFNNLGVVDLETGTLLCNGGFTNSGTANLYAGTTLRLAAGGSAGGYFTASGAALVEWTGGTFAVNPGAQFNGDGLYRINQTATVTANADVAVPNLDLLAGTLGGTGVVTITYLMNWTGGTMSGGGRTIIPPGVTVNAATIGVLSVNARTLENGGTILWNGTGNFVLNSSAVISNRVGALFHVQNAATFTSSASGSRFDNAGTFRKSVNSGTATFAGGAGFSVAFNNFGTVEIQTGTLSLAGGGAHNGNFNVAAETTLNLSGGTHTASGSSTLMGDGQFTVSGGTANLTGAVNIGGTNSFTGGTANLTGGYVCTNNTMILSGGTANFNGTGTISPAVILLSNGTLGGSNVVTVLNAMNWSGGNMIGSGRTIIASAAALNINPPSSAGLSTRTLENGGSVTWVGGGVFGITGSAVITNRPAAQFHIENESISGFGGASANGRFDNAGTFRKSAGTGTTLIASGLNFTNYGTVDIRSGILAANGTYTSSSNALLNCGISGTNAGTGYGRFQKSGAIALNGALSVDFINGFSPSLNDSFTVLTAGTRNGAFNNFFYASNVVTMQLSNTANSVIARVTGFAVPRPLLLPPELIGPDIKLTWTAVSNITYRLEFNSDQTNFTNWNILPGDVTATGNTASKLDSFTPSNRLYRVRVFQ